VPIDEACRSSSAEQTVRPTIEARAPWWSACSAPALTPQIEGPPICGACRECLLVA